MLRFSGDIPDDRAEWHHNYTPIESWIQAHILRKVNGWTIQKTAERIRAERDMPQMLGFFEDDPDYTPLVTASRFLAVAEGMFGLGSKPPPD